MNRKLVLLIIAVAGVFAATSAISQERPYSQVMKDVGATFASLRKNIDMKGGTAIGEDAAKLERLFGEVETWWEPLKTKDALRYATSARDAAAAVVAAAKGGDLEKANASYATIQKSCGACHFSHREDTGKGFLIKP